MTTTHKTWVDESVADDGEMWQAVCEGCPWSSRWVHADEFVHLLNGKPVTDDDLDEDGGLITTDNDELTTPGDQAHGQAKELGREHEEGQ